jgi:hypothetical protein
MEASVWSVFPPLIWAAFGGSLLLAVAVTAAIDTVNINSMYKMRFMYVINVVGELYACAVASKRPS